MNLNNESEGQHPMLIQLGQASMMASLKQPSIQQTQHTPIRFEGLKQSWRASFRRGCQALDRGNMQEALDMFRGALDQAENTAKRSADPSISLCSNALGFCYLVLGALAPNKFDAQYFNQNAYEYLNKSFQVDMDNIPRYSALTLLLSSKLYLAKGQVEKADKLFLQSLERMGDEKPIWPMPITTAALHHHQALLKLSQEEYTQAKNSLKESLKLLSTHLGVNHPWTRNVEKMVNAIHQRGEGDVVMLNQTDQMINKDFGHFFATLIEEMRLMPKS